MQPVEPSTMVRGPAALTMSFMTSADSHPWQVRWPEEKYSLISTFLTPLKGRRFCVSRLINSSSAITSSLLLLGALFSNAQPVGRLLGPPGLCRMFTQLDCLCHVLDGHLAAAQPAYEADQGWSLLGVIQGRPHLVGHHAGAEGRSERIV